MKIYILTIDELYECEGYSHKPRAFTDKNKALNELHEEYLSKKEAIAKQEGKNWDEDEFKKGDTKFSLYPAGNWGTSHYDGKVEEVEVEE